MAAAGLSLWISGLGAAAGGLAYSLGASLLRRKRKRDATEAEAAEAGGDSSGLLPTVEVVCGGCKVLQEAASLQDEEATPKASKAARVLSPPAAAPPTAAVPPAPRRAAGSPSPAGSLSQGASDGEAEEEAEEEASDIDSSSSEEEEDEKEGSAGEEEEAGGGGGGSPAEPAAPPAAAPAADDFAAAGAWHTVRRDASKEEEAAAQQAPASSGQDSLLEEEPEAKRARREASPAAAPAEAAEIRAIASPEEWEAHLAASQGDLTVAAFSAVWPADCQLSGEALGALRRQLEPGMVLVTVDVDDVEEVADDCGVTAIPAFQLWDGGRKVGEYLGADIDEVLSLIDSYAEEPEAEAA